MNILSFKYLEELNQHSIVDAKAIKYYFPSLEFMMDEFSKYVEDIIPKNNDIIHIGISFTNNQMRNIHIKNKDVVRSNINPMFWPIYGEIEYKFRKGDFYLNDGLDPKRIVTNVFSKGEWEKFFFTKNPYENKNDYKEEFYYELPDLFDKEVFKFGGPPKLREHFIDKYGNLKIPKFKPCGKYL